MLVGSIQSLLSERETGSHYVKMSRAEDKERRFLLASKLKVYKSLLVGTARDRKWASLRQKKSGEPRNWTLSTARRPELAASTRESVVALFGKL